MSTVVQVTPTAVSKRLVRVAFDDGTTVVVPARVADGTGAAPGVTLLPMALDELRAEEEAAAKSRAVRKLARADRTEYELRADLAACGFSREATTSALQVLEEQRLVDDARSAESHVELRGRSQPRSRRMLRNELRRRGVPADVAEGATADVDDAEGAFRLAERRAARAPRETYAGFRDAIGPFLVRRGYDHETAERAIRRAWDEVG